LVITDYSMEISQKEFYKSHAKLKAFEEYKGNRLFSEEEILERSVSYTHRGSADQRYRLQYRRTSLMTAIAHSRPAVARGAEHGTRKAATARTFALLKDIIHDSIVEETDDSITIVNSAGRGVFNPVFQRSGFSITEHLESGDRKLVSIEIKGGMTIRMPTLDG